MVKFKIILVFVALIFVSCNDLLDVKPRDLIIDENAFASYADLESGTLGAYATLSGANMIDVSSRMSDDLRIGIGNRGQGRQTHEWVVNSGTAEATGIWATMYGTVATINRVLANADRLVGNGTVTAAQVAGLKGELLAMRAMLHFDLWRVFSVGRLTGSSSATANLAVPYVSLEDMNGNGIADGLDPNNLPARLTNNEFFALVEKDLSDARTLLPESSNLVFRITQNAVIGLQARVALYKGDYANAATHASTVIGRLPLDTRSQVAGLWSDNSNVGVVFALPRVVGDARVGTLFTDLNNDIFFQPSYGVVDLYAANDVRKGVFFGKVGSDDIVAKYTGKTGQTALNNIKMIRVAEMVLIRAEALARTNSLANAAADLNGLRAQRIEGYTNQTFATQSDLIEAILEEKRKELVYEGHRWFDMKRVQMALERDSRDCVSGATPCSIDASDYRWTFPIPQGEIFANDNMVQNDGYND